MSSDQNKAIVRRLLEEPWKGDLRVVDELIDRNYVGYDPSIPEPLRGPDGFKENISTYRAAYSDARITVDGQIAEGDRVATRWTGRGTHDGVRGAQIRFHAARLYSCMRPPSRSWRSMAAVGKGRP